MHRMFLFLIAALLAALTTARAADDDPWKDVIPLHRQTTVPIPKYDVDGLCHHRGGERGSPGYGSILLSCQEEQQKAYDDLKVIWGDATQPMREKCDAKAHRDDGAGFGSYYILQFCVKSAISDAAEAAEDARDAAKAEKFKFKY